MKPAAKKRSKPTKSTLFETIPCPLCGATTYKVVRAGQFPKDLSEEFLQNVYRSSSDNALFEQVVECKKCGVVYLNPRLKPGLIIDAYAEGQDSSFISQDPMRVRTFTHALKKLTAKYFPTGSKKLSVLDIGCAGGAFLQAARSLGFKTVGIEPNRWLSQYARKEHKLDVRAGVLSDHHFPDKTFDLVTLWDVIEHVPAPKSELSEIHRILAPKGILVVNYPDHVSLPARLLGKKWPFWLSVHLTYYTPTTIKKQLEKCGFEVLAIKPHWQTLEFAYVLKRITPYFGLAKYLKSGVEAIGLAHLPIKYWVGQTQVVARKKG